MTDVILKLMFVLLALPRSSVALKGEQMHGDEPSPVLRRQEAQQEVVSKGVGSLEEEVNVKVFSLHRGVWAVPSDTTFLRYNFSGESSSTASLLTLCYRIRFAKFNQLSTHVSYILTDELDHLGTYNIGYQLLTWLHGRSQANSISSDAWQVYPDLWTHLCHVFTLSTYLIYWEGQVFYTSEMDAGWSLSLNGTLVVGQDQDSLGGSFDSTQSFQGDIAQVSLWDRALSGQEVVEVARCGEAGRGNIFSSDTSTLEVVGDVTLTSTPLTHLCRSTQSYYFVLLPEMKTIFKSLAQCRVLNATVATPTSDHDTSLLTGLMQGFTDVCSPTNPRKAWLGISDEHEEDVWRDLSTNKTVEYLNFKGQFPSGGNVFNCATIKPDGSWSDTTCHNTERKCAYCYMERRDFLRLRGLCFLTQLHARFRLTNTYVEGRPLFLGYYDRLIRWQAETRQWVLVDVERNNATLLKTTGVMTKSYPVGKHTWSIEEEMCGLAEGNKVSLSLSWCDDKQFMCDSGDCIRQSERCNLRYECSDGSDEVSCSRVLVGEEYQKQFPPVGTNTSLLLLHTSLILNRVANVDEINMAISLEFELMFRWLDGRVNLRYLKTGTILSPDDIEKVWVPTYQLLSLHGGQAKLLSQNMVVATANNATQPNFNNIDIDVLYPGSSNQLSLLHHYTASVTCDFLFWSYPVDVQVCHIKVGLPSTYHGRVHFSSGSNMQYTGAEDLALYTVINPSVSHQSSHNLVMFEFQLRRRPGLIILSTFLPSMLLLLVSWATLFIKLEALNARAIMSLTTLLVLYTLFSNFSSSLPKSSEIKLIDIWFFSIIFLLFINIMIHVFISLEGTGRVLLKLSRVRATGEKQQPSYVGNGVPVHHRFLFHYRTKALPAIIVILNVAFCLALIF